MELSIEQVQGLRGAVTAAQVKLAPHGCAIKVMEERFQTLLQRHDDCNSSSYSVLLDTGALPKLPLNGGIYREQEAFLVKTYALLRQKRYKPYLRNKL